MGGRLMLGMLANTPSSYLSPDQLSLVNRPHARICGKRSLRFHKYRLRYANGAGADKHQPHPNLRCHASIAAMTSSETSKLAKMFCTSSQSSSASISLNTLRAASSSTGTVIVGTSDDSAES
jgi:hypothetical protein